MTSTDQLTESVWAPIEQTIRLYRKSGSSDHAKCNKAPIGSYPLYVLRNHSLTIPIVSLKDIGRKTESIWHRTVSKWSDFFSITSDKTNERASIFTESKFLAYQDKKYTNNKFDETSHFIKFLIAFQKSVRSDPEALPDQIRESILERIRTIKKHLNYILLSIIPLRNGKRQFRDGIGKGVEGYIPFITWARGSLFSQPANNINLNGKLSQLNNLMELSNGC